ncbi:MAG: hypothetical protein H0U74_18375 [Bradymonadaceae bacterium]|nr:hypothetical protein [Lujinxingiaceae bacterium]
MKQRKRKKGGSAPGPLGQRRTIADKLAQRMHKYLQAKVVDLRSVRDGKMAAEDLRATVASSEKLAELHPAHALYVYAQNEFSVIAEHLLVLPEMRRFYDFIVDAEDMYLPGYPPMSPITGSYFSSWSLFDVPMGWANETVGTIVGAVGPTLGIHPELSRIFEILQASRMGIYRHEGPAAEDEDDTLIHLRDIITGQPYRTMSPAGHAGRPGELWYTRYWRTKPSRLTPAKGPMLARRPSQARPSWCQPTLPSTR